MGGAVAIGNLLQAVPLGGRVTIIPLPGGPRKTAVRTENLNPSVAVMKSAQEGV